MRSEHLVSDDDGGNSLSFDGVSSDDAMVTEDDDDVLDDDVFDDDDAFDDDVNDVRQKQTVQQQERRGTSDRANGPATAHASVASSSGERKRKQSSAAPASCVPTVAASDVPQTAGRRRQQTANAAPTKRTQKTNAVRKRVARDADNGADDPYDNTVFESATETMADEMQAMKQVFMRMSAKKMQQKEERMEQCKRLYKDAFKTDIDRAFKRASRARVTAMDEASSTLQRLGSELETSAVQLRDAHATYKKSFAMEFERASSDVDALKRILQDADAQRARALQRVDAEFQDIEDAVERSLVSLRSELDAAAADKTFVSAFKRQLERLQ